MSEEERRKLLSFLSKYKNFPNSKKQFLYSTIRRLKDGSDALENLDVKHLKPKGMNKFRIRFMANNNEYRIVYRTIKKRGKTKRVILHILKREDAYDK